MALVPIGSSADGGIIYRDTSTGATTTQYSSDSSAIGSSTAGYPIYPSQPSEVNTPLPDTTNDGGTAVAVNPTPDPGTEEPLPYQEPNWDEILAPAFAAYDQTSAILGQNLQASIGQAEQEADTQKQGLKVEETERLGEFGSQRTREEGRTRGMIDEARRQASQLQQGIQSRFGGSTGTGGFMSEIVGSQAMANIGKNQEALQYTLGEISKAENNLKNRVMQMVQEVDTQLAGIRTNLRNAFNERIAEIGNKKGELQSSVASRKLELLNEYQNYVRDVAARAQARKEELYDAYVRKQDQLARLQASAEKDYSALLNQPAINVGDTSYKWIPGVKEPYLATGKIGKDEDEDVY